VFSGSYLARTSVDWLNMLFYGVDSKSNVATVGSQNVVGPGQIAGTRAVITLPPLENFFHTVSIGADFKHFGETVTQSNTGASFSSPVTYFPVTVSYNATWQREGAVTQLNAGLTAGTRGLGSTAAEFDARRTFATESFLYLRADASHTYDLPGKFQIFAKVQGQVADQPLVSSEEFSVGGLDTVRGYLESESLGDSAMVATAELRTPNLGDWIATPPKEAATPPQQPVAINEWRFFVFGDAGRAFVLQPLSEQTSVFNLASYGVGTRFKLYNYANGMVVFAMPVVGDTFTSANHPRILFRVWGEL
jgi:hemolysin activation/secretion protein